MPIGARPSLPGKSPRSGSAGQLNNLPGLPLNTKLQLSEKPFVAPSCITSREECVRIARDQSPDERAAKQAVERAKATVGVAKYAYIPDVTPFARYSYQSGIPFLASGQRF